MISSEDNIKKFKEIVPRRGLEKTLSVGSMSWTDDTFLLFLSLYGSNSIAKADLDVTVPQINAKTSGELMIQMRSQFAFFLRRGELYSKMFGIEHLPEKALTTLNTRVFGTSFTFDGVGFVHMNVLQLYGGDNTSVGCYLLCASCFKSLQFGMVNIQTLFPRTCLIR
jgi:hypothetical protein